MENQDIFCPSCKAKSPLGNNFCLECGSEIEMSISPLGENTYWLNVLQNNEHDSIPTVEIKEPIQPQNFTKIPMTTKPEQVYSPKRNGIWRKVPAVIVVLLILGSITITLNFYIGAKQADPQTKPVELAAGEQGSQNSAQILEVEKELPPEFEGRGYGARVTDPNGKTGEIVMGILGKRFVWESGSISNVIELGNLLVLGKDAFTERFQTTMKKAPEVIVVGTADVKNTPKGGQMREIARANDRSKILFDVVEEIREEEQTIKKLNLGQWTGPENIPLEDQRRIIFIWFKRKDKGFDLEFGVRKALETYQTAEPIFGQMLNNYSNFDLS